MTLHIEAPFGLADLVALLLRPNPYRKTLHCTSTGPLRMYGDGWPDIPVEVAQVR